MENVRSSQPTIVPLITIFYNNEQHSRNINLIIFYSRTKFLGVSLVTYDTNVKKCIPLTSIKFWPPDIRSIWIFSKPHCKIIYVTIYFFLREQYCLNEKSDNFAAWIDDGMRY
jgi:hypothetical protein